MLRMITLIALLCLLTGCRCAPKYGPPFLLMSEEPCDDTYGTYHWHPSNKWLNGPVEVRVNGGVWYWHDVPGYRHMLFEDECGP